MGKVKNLLQDKIDKIVTDYDTNKITGLQARQALKRLGLNDDDVDHTMNYVLYNRSEGYAG